MKLKKGRIAILAIIVIIVIAVASFLISMNKNISTYNDFDFAGIDLATTPDGTYTGSEDGGIVKASVEVTVKDHAITQIKILSHECKKGKPAEVILDTIVEKNNLEVDTISGATYSSNVIRMAVYNALAK